MTSPTAVLDFWLDEIGPKGWYKKDPTLDSAIAERFGDTYARAVAGHYADWGASARGSLALLILLDQFSRNMFRDTADAFTHDGEARRITKSAIARGLDLQIAEPERQFFYVTLMHSESLADQQRGVRLFLLNCRETGAENLRHAIAHRDVIRRFGRFPSRNAALGRTDTAAEIAYRADGGYMS